jgi:hypothetical protein
MKQNGALRIGILLRFKNHFDSDAKNRKKHLKPLSALSGQSFKTFLADYTIGNEVC